MITIPSVLETVSTRRDNTLKLVFGTNELPPSIVSNLFSQHNKYGFLMFKDQDFNPNDIDKMSKLKVDLDDRTKTPSQRLRGVLFRMYEQDAKGFDTFAKYYDHHMEKVIEHFKKQLDQ